MKVLFDIKGIMSADNEKEKSKQTNGGCLLGLGGLTYLLCFLFAIAVVFFVIWFSTRILCPSDCVQKTQGRTGSYIMSKFTRSSVTPVM
jgi:hypothetical protein